MLVLLIALGEQIGSSRLVVENFELFSFSPLYMPRHSQPGELREREARAQVKAGRKGRESYR